MIYVRVPATSANLGPGLDCLGLALSLYLEVEAEPAEHDRFEYRGSGKVDGGPANLVHQGFKAAFGRLGRSAPPVALRARNDIPPARGLGSSSAALVAGAAVADAWTDGALGREGVFQLTAGIEGHPDNVGPAVYGGLTVAAANDEGGFTAATLPVPPAWRLLFGVPAFELATGRSRAVLPETVDRGDAVHTAARTALWLAAAATDQPALLRTASLDVLHEHRRERLVPGLARARAELRAAGAHAAFLSGAGPTVGAVVPDQHVPACRAVLERFAGDGGSVLELPAAEGYAVTVAAPPAP